MRRVVLGVLCAALATMALAPVGAHAAAGDPLFIFKPKYKPPPPGSPPLPPIPPPDGDFEGPCGLAVDATGNFYVSDYYHRAVDFFERDTTYIGQLAAGSLQGPCAIALDGLGNLYANNFHNNVVRFSAGVGTVIDPVNSTGVAVNPATNNVYVDERTQVGVYSPAGTRLGQIGSGNIGDGYGLAVSGFPATAGRIYVPDSSTETVKVYEPTLGGTTPVATIDGSATPNGHFTSLRNSAVAIDSESGEIYVADDLQPEYSERGETVVYVFSFAGVYEGRLKYSVENGLPPGLAVDNSPTVSQGRVYVTSGNTELGEVYAYPAGAATASAVPLPPLPPGASPGAGSGSVVSAASDRAAGAPTEASASSAVDTGEPIVAKRPARRAKYKAKHHRKHHHQRRGNR